VKQEKALCAFRAVELVFFDRLDLSTADFGVPSTGGTSFARTINVPNMSQQEQLKTMIEAGQLSAAQRQIAPDMLELQAEIAWRRGGAIYHLARAAEDSAIDARDRARFGAELVRLAAKEGARQWATAQLARLEQALGAVQSLELCRAQLQSGLLEGRSDKELRAAKQLAAGDAAAAEATYRELVSDKEAHAELRRDAWRRLALLARQRRDLAQAAVALEKAVSVLPHSDESARLSLLAAQDRWLAGEAKAAVEQLRGLRRELEQFEDSTSRYLHHHAGELRSSFERRIADGPALVWLDQSQRLSSLHDDSGWRACFRMIQPLLEGCPVYDLPALSDSDVPEHQSVSLARLRVALGKAGLQTMRIRLTMAVAETLLRHSLLAVVEEERSTRTGLMALVGVDPRGELLLFRDPSLPGPVVRHCQDYARRAALHGQGALLVLPETSTISLAELAEHGIEQDAQLLAVDRCEVDEDGHMPPQARVAALARDAIAVAPEMPMPHKRLGEALLAQLTLGHAVGAQFDRWLLGTRTRFPDAEWPFQLHAQALALRGCYAESVIAWSDAAERDPCDERNLIGQARGLFAIGRLEQAEILLYDALRLNNAAVDAYALAAEIAVQSKKWSAAKLLAEIGLAIRADEPDLLLVAATAFEREGALEQARESLEKAAAAAPDHTVPRLRLMRHHVDAGNWMAASDFGEMLTELAPDASVSWHSLSWVRRCMGQSGAAFDAACNGIQRCGAQAELLEQAAGCIQTMPEIAHQGALDTLVSLLSGSPETIMDLAVELHGRGLGELALPLGESLVCSNSRSPGLSWALARLLLSDTQLRVDHRGRVEGLLRESVSHGGGFAYPAGILGWLVLEKAPSEALAIVESANPVAAPALLWLLVSKALHALGRRDEAAVALGRLDEVLPEGAIAPAALLRQLGWPNAARELLEHARRRDPAHPGVLYELARTAEVVGQSERAVVLLEEAIKANPSDEGLLWGLLDIAFSASHFERVIALSEQLLHASLRDSHHEYFDPWVVRARLAAAKLALGDSSARDDLLERAANHPKVALALFRASSRQGHPTAEEDGARLRRLAEPLYQRVITGAL
jgi:tetratricopeptide (TPR) repeat protein